MDLKEQINLLVEQHNLIDRTYEYFWENYDNYLKEGTEEAKEYNLIDRKSINPILRSIHYILTGIDEKNNSQLQLISVTLSLFNNKDDDIQIGYYDCTFFMNGEVEDDYFVIN